MSECKPLPVGWAVRAAGLTPNWRGDLVELASLVVPKVGPRPGGDWE